MITRIRNGKIVTTEGTRIADLWVDDEKILAIGDGPDVADTTIAADGCLIFPGGIDPHVHMGFTVGEFTSSDGFASGSKAAAFGGVTTILDFAVPDGSETLSTAVERRIREAEGDCSVDFGVHAVITQVDAQLLEEIQRCIKIGAPDFKTFTTYVGLQLTSRDLLHAMRQVQGVGGLIMVHAEDDAQIAWRQEALVAAEQLSPDAHSLSRPAVVESTAVREVLMLQEETGCPVHFVHISAAKSVERVREARLRGRDVSAETCPQYLLHTHAVYQGDRAAFFMISPPIKSQADQRSLWGALRDRTIGMVATDHCPFTAEEKTKYQDFREIPTGMPGVETTLPLLYTAWQARGWPLGAMVEALSTGPAKRFGLYPQKGALAAGSDADLVIFDPSVESVIRSDKLHMNVDWSPFEGFRIQGAVRDVMLRGRLLIERGEWVGEGGAGRFLHRSPRMESRPQDQPSELEPEWRTRQGGHDV